MKKQKTIRAAGVLLAVIWTLAFAPAVSAHPLGNFTINHYSEILVTPERVGVTYILDMAEIPAFQEIATFDKNQNGKADDQEVDAYTPKKCESIGHHLELARQQAPIPLALQAAQTSFPPGAGGLPTLRLTCSFVGATGRVAPKDQISYHDRYDPNRLGWREIVVTADGIGLSGAFSGRSISNRLTAYPEDMLSSPLDVRGVAFQVNGSAQTIGLIEQTGAARADRGWLGVRSDRFTELITLQEFTPASILLALAIAFIWGGLHSLTPGHGKAIVGAYLVGSRGTPRHAFYLGLMTTVTHTMGVFALGAVTLLASRTILPERLFPWISLFSGLLVVIIGFGLAVSRLRQVILARRHRQHEHTHSHAHDLSPHEHDHDHLHPAHAHEPHTHRPGGHQHLPPAGLDEKVSFRSLLTLGISGGLLPCPSALVVLLGAIALGRVGFGIALVLAFSLGLAAVLTGIGLLMVYGRRFFERIPLRSRVFELIPAGSALFIIFLGAGITYRALVEIGAKIALF